MSRFRRLFPREKIIIGLTHLPPLPDYPESPGIDAIREHALADLRVLRQCGVDGILIENEYDRPHRILAAAATLDAMTAVTEAIVAAAGDFVVGCEILLNDPRASLDVASSCNAKFIRTDYFVDRMSRSEYGEFDIDPQGLMDHRERTGASEILVLADIQVKYATMLEERSLAESAELACRMRADAVIVTGDETGDAPSIAQLRAARTGVVADGQNIPVLIGSGLTAGNAGELLAECDGAIVGTALMRDRRVDVSATRSLMQAVQGARA